METRTEAIATESDLIGRVVAWHNRHWLTQRIGPAQVTGLGVVALPFAAAAVDHATEPAAAAQPDRNPPSLLSRAAAFVRMLARPRLLSRKDACTGQPMFRGDFLAPLKPAEVARFARLHGSIDRPGDPAWPQRDIPVARGGPRGPAENRFVQTAAIEAGRHRLRVLVGCGADPQVIGPRLWDRRRLAAVVSSAAAMLAVASALTVPWSVLLPDALISGAGDLPGDGQTATVAAAAAPAPAPPAPIPPAATADVDELASEDPTPPPEQTEPAEDPAPPTPVAAEDAPASGDILVKGGDSHEAPRRAETGPASASSLPPASPPTAASRKPAAEASPAGQQPLFAVAIQPTKTRVGSQLRVALLNLPTEPQDGTPHADIMKVGQNWRAVIWPFADREAAEAVRQTLAARGIEVEVIDF